MVYEYHHSVSLSLQSGVEADKIDFCLDNQRELPSWLCFYQTRSAWSVDQGSNKNHSPAYNFAPTVTKFCVMWEGLSLPHDTKFGNSRCTIVDSRAFLSWSLIHGLRWSGLIKAEPGHVNPQHCLCFFFAVTALVIYHMSLNVVWSLPGSPEPLFTKRTDVLSQDLLKSRNREIHVWTIPIALRFDRRLGRYLLNFRTMQSL